MVGLSPIDGTVAGMGDEEMTPTQFTLDAVKHVAHNTPQAKLSISAIDLSELIERAEAAEAHNANLIKEVKQWRIHVEQVEQDRDELRAAYLGALKVIEKQRQQLEQAIEALRLLATDPITSGMSAHYRLTCSGAYREKDKRTDPLENAVKILGGAS